jgi:hypothetical protein
MTCRYHALALLLAMAATSAIAGPITVFNGSDSGVVFGSPLPGSDAAAASFDAAVLGLGQTVKTIDFETAPLGTISSSLPLGNGATLGVSNTSNSTSITTNQNVFGMFNTTPGGSHYFAFVTKFINLGDTTTASSTFDFDSPINAFGGYFTGIGDDETFTLGFIDGSSHTLTVPGSSAEFFGFIDPGGLINSVTLTQVWTNNQGNNFAYFVGLDDVHFSSVPEPGTLPLLGLAIAGFALFRRKQR